jgi:predicted ATPase/DNA-binding SARP family transcriptional activator
MSSLKLYLLGPPQIEFDGELLKLDARKNVALLGYLAVTRENQTRESLITLLWPELEPSRARAGLRRNLSVLRKALADEWLVVDRETIGLKISEDFWLDVEKFLGLITSDKGHDHPDNEVCPVCLENLAMGVELYRGDFLQGFSLRDSSNFDEWQFFQTENLRQELATALEKLVYGHTAENAFRKAIPYTRRWLQVDPLHEPAYRRLMELYTWTGQWAAALHQYEVCERTLREQLDVAPSDETINLYKTIKRDRVLTTPEQSLEKHSSISENISKNNLPAQSTPFVGRQAELVELTRLLLDDDNRLVTILGTGGMGKTRLALEIATKQLGQFPHGVFYIPLARLHSVDSITSAVAEAMDFSFYERSAPHQQLLNALRSKDILLILDNIEHLLESSQWVNEVLKVAPNVKILATSRIKLNLQAENVFPIAGMDYPVELSYPNYQQRARENTAEYGAIQLFIQAARRVKPNFKLVQEDYQKVIRICQLVEGMPLAILLAANWVEVLTINEIVEEIKKGLDFLEVDLQDIPARQRSVRAVFDHSWRLLSETEKTVFQELSIFRAGFTRDAASKIVGSSLHDLRILVSKSLLHYTSTGRYEMHELIRQFAVDKLSESPSVYHLVRERHTEYYASYIQQRETKLKGTQPQVILNEIETESSNAYLAWNWAVENQQLNRIDQMVDGLHFFYLCRMRYQEGEVICQQAIDILKSVVAGEGLRILSKIMMWQGIFNYRLGLSGKSDQILNDSLTLLEDTALTNQDTRIEKAAILMQMGHTVFDQNRKKALDLYQQSLTLYRSLDDQWGIANALSALSWSMWSGGEYDAAKEKFEETLMIRQSLGDIQGIVDSLSGLGQIEIFLGQFEEAERLMYESLKVLHEIGSSSDYSNDQNIFSEEKKLKKDVTISTNWYQEKVGLYSDLGFSHSLAPSNSILGFILKHLGRYEEARYQAGEGLALARQVGWHQEEGLTLEVLGEICLAEKAYDKALDYLMESAGILRSTGQLELYEVIALLGYVYLRLSQIPTAIQHLVEAMQLASSVPTVFPIITALMGFALFFAEIGEVERAVELFAFASLYPRIANSYWFEDIAGYEISQLAEALPPERIKKAKERGRRRDLDTTVADLIDEFSKIESASKQVF